MGHITLENFPMMKSMVKVSILGMMEEFIMENG